MEITVKKDEEGLFIRFPKNIAQEANLKDGMVVEIIVHYDRFELLLPGYERLTLDDLLARVTPENLHEFEEF